MVKQTMLELFLPTEEEPSAEKVSEQSSRVVHLGEDYLMAVRAGDLNWAVSQWTDRSCRKTKIESTKRANAKTNQVFK